jgi:hypothetical protein
MDEKILKIVASQLKKFEGETIDKEKLSKIREAVFKATGKNKYASFEHVKKWIKAARSFIKNQQKTKKSESESSDLADNLESTKKFVEPSLPAEVEQSVNAIKEEKVVEIAPQKPTIVFDKIYLQNIKFEIAAIRQTMERVSRQLDRLEKEISQQSKEEE